MPAIEQTHSASARLYVRTKVLDSKQLIQKELSHERLGRGLAGTGMLLAVVLGHFLHPFFLLAAVGIGANLILSSITNHCKVKDLMVFAGVPGEREIALSKLESEKIPEKSTCLSSECHSLI